MQSKVTVYRCVLRWNVDFADIYEGDDSWAYLSFNIVRGHERDDLLRQWDQEMKDGLSPNELSVGSGA